MIFVYLFKNEMWHSNTYNYKQYYKLSKEYIHVIILSNLFRLIHNTFTYQFFKQTLCTYKEYNYKG